MKKYLYIVMLLSLLGCEKEIKQTSHQSEIRMFGAFSSSKLDAASTTESDSIPLFFARANDGVVADWSTVKSEELPKDGFGSGIVPAYMICSDPEQGGEIHLLNRQFFDLNTDNNAHLVGFTPRYDDFVGGTTWQSMSLSWNIDGTEDLLISDVISGNDQTMTGDVTFRHRLCWLQMYVTAYDSISKEVWGDVISLKLINAKNRITYSPPINFSLSGSAIIPTYKENFTIPDTSGLDGILPVSVDSSRYFSQAYVPAVPYDNVNNRHFQIEIKTTKHTEYKNIKIGERVDLESEYIYKVRLIFRMGNVSVDPRIIPWEGENIEGEIE